MSTPTIYIDKNALLFGAGTAYEPFLTCQEAMDWAEENLADSPDVRFVLRSGLYETNAFNFTTWAGPPSVSIEGDGQASTYISGFTLFSSWARVEGTNIWYTTWALDTQGEVPAFDIDNGTIREWYYGSDPLNIERATILTYNNHVVVQGSPLEQKLSLEDLTEAGTFLADEDNDLLYVHLLGDASPLEQRVYITTKYYGIRASTGGTLEDLSLRDLTVMGFRDNISISGVPLTCLNISTTLAAGKGFMASLCPVTMTGVLSTKNGYDGFQVNFSVGSSFTDCVASYNNNRGAWVGAASWQVAGFGKFYACRDMVLTRCRSLYNKTLGMWFDRWCNEIVLDNCQIMDNECGGLFWEISGDETGGDFGIQLIDTDIIGNATNNTLDGVRYGLCMDQGRQVEVVRCRFLRNTPYDWYVKGSAAGREVTKWEGEELGETTTILNGEHSIQATELGTSLGFASYLLGAGIQRSYFQEELTVEPEVLRVRYIPHDYITF